MNLHVVAESTKRCLFPPVGGLGIGEEEEGLEKMPGKKNFNLKFTLPC